MSSDEKSNEEQGIKIFDGKSNEWQTYYSNGVIVQKDL
jgi:hypothetical protein